MRLENAVALVTGANGGIGQYYIEALRTAGVARIYAGARNPNSLTEMVRAEPQHIMPISLDIVDQQSVLSTIRQKSSWNHDLVRVY